METVQNEQNPKHVKRFWAIFVIIVLAAVAGGIIYFYANDSIRQDDINSLSFWSHFSLSKTAVKRVPGK